MYTIYLITNINNGKLYVGVTKQPLRKRFEQHGRKSSNCSLLSKAIKKHGLDSFQMTVLDTAGCKNQAELIEAWYIEEMKSLFSENGYNLKSGGEYVNNHSEITKRKMSRSHIGKKRPPMTEEQKVKISKTRLERKIRHSAETIEKVRMANLGRKFPKEFGEAISKRQLGKNNPSAVRLQASTGEIFDCIVDAANWCGGNRSAISHCIKGLSKSSGRHPITNEKLSWNKLP